MTINAAGACEFSPTGDEMIVVRETGGMVYLRHPEHGFIVGIPKNALPPPTKVEVVSGVQGKGRQ